MDNVENRIRKLEQTIRKHQYLYYIKNQPIITDREFDRLFSELQNLEKEYPEYVGLDSPTRVVGSDLDNEFQKVKHTIPVLSLSNTYSTDEAVDWAYKTIGDKKNVKLNVQWKVDGASLVLYYEKGRLVRAVTRGSGQLGDDVTANALTIRNIPHVLPEPITLAVRGEVYMAFSDFAAFNEREGSIYANPRNTAAGSLKHKKSRVIASRPLRLVAFDAHFNKGQPQSDDKALSRLAELKLPVFSDNACVPISKLKKTITDFKSQKNKMPMPVDGLVLKLDNMKLREELGFTAASPRWAVSLKFEPEISESVVEDIEVFVGRTGRITPRAKLTPVKLAGTTVMYATLHNADFIENLGVKIGSRVKVSKHGEIIPAVEEVVDPGDGPSFGFPTKCPVCRTVLIKEKDAIDWMCPNTECSEKKINGIIFFCQRKQMDITGMGERIVRTLYEKEFIKNITNIYSLHEYREDLEKLEGFGIKSVNQLLNGIEESKKREFRYVLPALGLREVGHSITETLINSGYNTIEKIIKLAKAKNAVDILSEINGIGPKTSSYIIRHFTDLQIISDIKTLKKAGLQFSAAQIDDDETFQNLFSGQVWCVTGSFVNFKPRDLAMEIIKKHGGRIVSTITSKTTHLLTGEGGGSKLEKAQKADVTIVSEDEFMQLISTE